MLLTESQISDYYGAHMLLPVLPDTHHLIANKGYDSTCFHEREGYKSTRLSTWNTPIVPALQIMA